jgi:hypothetical protein
MSTNQERENKLDDKKVLKFYLKNTGVLHTYDEDTGEDQETIVCAPLKLAAFEIGISEDRVRKSIRRWNEWWSAQGAERSLSYLPGVGGGYFQTMDAKYRRAVIKHQASVGNGVIRSARTETEQTAKCDPYVLHRVLSEVAQGEEVTARLLAVVQEAFAV